MHFLNRGKIIEGSACMSELGTDTLNNEVVEYSKDHYIMVKRRDVEN